MKRVYISDSYKNDIILFIGQNSCKASRASPKKKITCEKQRKFGELSQKGDCRKEETVAEREVFQVPFK